MSDEIFDYFGGKTSRKVEPLDTDDLFDDEDDVTEEPSEPVSTADEGADVELADMDLSDEVVEVEIIDPDDVDPSEIVEVSAEMIADEDADSGEMDGEPAEPRSSWDDLADTLGITPAPVVQQPIAEESVAPESQPKSKEKKGRKKSQPRPTAAFGAGIFEDDSVSDDAAAVAEPGEPEEKVVFETETIGFSEATTPNVDDFFGIDEEDQDEPQESIVLSEMFVASDDPEFDQSEEDQPLNDDEDDFDVGDVFSGFRNDEEEIEDEPLDPVAVDESQEDDDDDEDSDEDPDYFEFEIEDLDPRQKSEPKTGDSRRRRPSRDGSPARSGGPGRDEPAKEEQEDEPKRRRSRRPRREKQRPMIGLSLVDPIAAVGAVETRKIGKTIVQKMISAMTRTNSMKKLTLRQARGDVATTETKRMNPAVETVNEIVEVKADAEENGEIVTSTNPIQPKVLMTISRTTMAMISKNPSRVAVVARGAVIPVTTKVTKPHPVEAVVETEMIGMAETIATTMIHGNATEIEKSPTYRPGPTRSKS